MKAIIPVRSGSTRVINKNIRPIAGTTLLELKIRQLLEVGELAAVCVNSDSPEMLEIAARCGAETYRRDPYYASNTVPMSEVYANMVEPLDCGDVLYATVTTPFIGPGTYREAIRLYRSREGGCDSVHAARRVHEFLIGPDGRPMNYDPARFPRSQDLPNIQSLVFGFSVLPRRLMMEKKSSVGYQPRFMQMSQLESIDIDTELDFRIAEYLLLQGAGKESPSGNPSHPCGGQVPS